MIFLSHGNRPAGCALPFQRQTLCLAEQLDASRDNNFRLSAAQSYVVAKIKNMRRVIQRLSANRGISAVANQWLGSMANQAAAAASIESLRGLEGAASGRYFETIAKFFPNDLPFERRSRRPPHNEANAILSFLYTILSAEFSVYLHASGLEPAWGVYHETEDGRPALSLDLMEPFRAPIVDSLVLDLLNHRRITQSDFERSDQGILIKRESRRKVFVAWEERMEREFFYEAAGHRTKIRHIIEKQCFEIKRCFRTKEAPHAFIMN